MQKRDSAYKHLLNLVKTFIGRTSRRNQCKAQSTARERNYMPYIRVLILEYLLGMHNEQFVGAVQYSTIYVHVNGHASSTEFPF